MDKYELLDRSAALRRVLWVWNGLCAAGVALCVVATVALMVDATTSDSYVDLSGPLAVVVFMLALFVLLVWAGGRSAILLFWRAVFVRKRSDLGP